jgi:hypothetical protein
MTLAGPLWLLQPRQAPSAVPLLLLLACLIAPAPAQGDSAGGLAARLDEATRQVEAARSAGAPLGDPGALFPETEEVSWKAEAIRVDHGSLRAEWRGVPAEGESRRQALERLRDRLAAVRAEVAPAGPAGGVEPSRDEGTGSPPPGWRDKLSEVLSRPEFKQAAAGEPRILRIIRWLRDKTAFLLSLLSPDTRRGLGVLFTWVLRILVAALLLCALVAFLLMAYPGLSEIFRAVRNFRPWGHRGPGPPRQPRPGQPDTPEGLLATAEARFRDGDSRGAVQAIFRWLLLVLHQGGRLDYDPALTNREHLARLKGDAGLRVAFEDLSGQFELAWYALRPVSPESYAMFRARCEQLARGQA